MQKMIFIMLLCVLLFVVNIFTNDEYFNICHRYDSCSKYNSESYSKCYNSGKCTVMIDLIGKAFCTNKIE